MTAEPQPPETQQPPSAFGEKRLETAKDVARLLGTNARHLARVLYEFPDDRRYVRFEIPKRTGGLRQIASPIGALRYWQYELLRSLEPALEVHPNAHGFLPGRSIVSNAAPHAGAKWVLNVDLADFFPSINFGRIRGLFMARPFHCGESAATVLAQICTFENGLPQGAPTSPVLSNYIASALDRRLRRLATKHKLEYTRYADDITFSSRAGVFPIAVAIRAHEGGAAYAVEPGEGLVRAIGASGFEINPKKVRLQGRGVRQSVTGLTVNVRPTVDRKRLRRLRAMIHSWSTHGLEAAAARHFARRPGAGEDPGWAFRNRVYGHLSFLGMARGRDDATYLKFCADLLKADPNPPPFLRRLVFRGDDYEVFLNHGSEDKEAIARPIYLACERLGLKAFLDATGLVLGDEYTDKIQVALQAAPVFLAVISPRSLEKHYARKEIDAALVREDRKLATIIPLLVDKPDLTVLPFLDNRHALFWDGDADKVARALYRAVRGEDPPLYADHPAPPLPGVTAAVPVAPTSVPQTPETPTDPDEPPDPPPSGGLLGGLFKKKR